MRVVSMIFVIFAISACMPAKFQVNRPDNSKLDVIYYPGGNTLDDLVIINEQNYFGKAAYQFDDPMGDIGFTFLDGKKIRSECISSGKDILGQDECKLYEVYRSNFELIPEGSKVPRPQLF